MDVYYAYSYGSACWLALQSVPLLVSPTIMVTLLSPDVREPTALEEYFSRSLGLAVLTLGMLTILLTGSVPLTSSLSDSVTAAVTTDPEDPKAPYALPTLTITAFHHAAVGFYCYTRFAMAGSMAFAVGSVANAGVAGVGLWCILFASSSGRISRKTGVDKRMSGFPFGNKESDKKRKEGRKSL